MSMNPWASSSQSHPYNLIDLQKKKKKKTNKKKVKDATKSLKDGPETGEFKTGRRALERRFTNPLITTPQARCVLGPRTQLLSTLNSYPRCMQDSAEKKNIGFFVFLLQCPQPVFADYATRPLRERRVPALPL